MKRLALAAWVVLSACTTVPTAHRTSLVLLPPYLSPTLTNGAGPALDLAAATGPALAASGRYALRTRGLFESGFDEALAAPAYFRTAVLEDDERQALVGRFGVDTIGVTDIVDDAPAQAYRVHVRVLDAATGFVRESFSATVGWKGGVDAWRKALAAGGQAAVLTPPRSEGAGVWAAWWAAAPRLGPQAARWKADLDSARRAGDFAEALRLADLVVDQTAALGDWPRQFLAQEARQAWEDQGVEKLSGLLSAPAGSTADEALLLTQAVALVRRTENLEARTEVRAAFRSRFGKDLAVLLAQPVLLPVPGGTFRMGSDDEADERPPHEVTVGSFLMGRTEITQEQYARIAGINPSLYARGPEAPQRPVERVSWYDAVEFCNRLSAEAGFEPVYALLKRSPAKGYPIKAADVTEDRSKNGYRLPTEAEWEWAAQGGTLGTGTLLAGGNDPAAVAWTDGNGGPAPVAAKRPNELGLYDLSGNVWEWCGDWYGKYSASASPGGPPTGILKVGRGGSWHAAAWNARVTARSYDNPGSRGGNIGFRVVRSLSGS